MTSETKNEIKIIFDKYKVTIDTNYTQDNDMTDILKNLQKDLIPRERPDAYVLREKCIYAIEHFCVSSYEKIKKSDSLMVAEGSKRHREKMKNDRDFSLKSSLSNLCDNIKNNLMNHSKSFEIYKENIMKLEDAKDHDYRLIIFLEDITAGYIVKKFDTTPINPLILPNVEEIILKYEDYIWGVIYSYGNELYKCLTGCTILELKENKKKAVLLNINDYVPFEVDRKIHVSKNNYKEDRTHSTIKLYDRI